MSGTRSNTKKNLIYQITYQVLAIFVPFITTPYLARTLQVESIGVYSYTYSIVYYFTMFAMLGVVSYGSKKIAEVSDNYEQRREKFWEIYSTQLLFCLLSTIVYLILINTVYKDNYLTILICQGTYILACFFDVNWFYFGIERFSVTVTRSIVVKIISVICILLFVKSPADLGIYVLIMGGGQLFSNIIVWCFVLRENHLYKIDKKHIFEHIRPLFVLFVPIFAMSFYHLMDKTMLGIFSTEANSGYYYNTDKVINIPLCVITGIGTVMLPRMSSVASKHDESSYRGIIKLSFRAYVCLSVAMAFGIAAIADDFVPVFFGSGYEPCIELIKAFCIALPFKALADMFRTQYLIPSNRNRVYIISVFIGAGLNLILDYVLISFLDMGAMGAVIATVITEAVVCVLQGIDVVKNEYLLNDIAKSLPYIVFGAVMYFAVQCISGVQLNNYVKLFTEILCGVFVYCVLCLVYWLISKDEILKVIKR